MFKVRSEEISKELAKQRRERSFLGKTQNVDCLCREFRLLESRRGVGKRREQGPHHSGLVNHIKDGK